MSGSREESFVVEGESLEIVDAMKEKFGVSTRIEVVKRAIALARVMGDMKRDDGTVTLIGRGEISRDIQLDG